MLNSIWQFILGLITYFAVKKAGKDEEVIKQQKGFIDAALNHKKQMDKYDSDPTVRDWVRSKFTSSK